MIWGTHIVRPGLLLAAPPSKMTPRIWRSARCQNFTGASTFANFHYNH
jgi:hypothetical protein